jgi:phage terminase small subunit
MAKKAATCKPKRSATKSRTKFDEMKIIFADEYIKDLNATQAAIRAGYAANSAAHTGYRLFKQPEVKALIADRMATLRDEKEQKHKDAIASAIEVEKYLTSVMRGESISEIVVTVGTGLGLSEAQHVEKKPDEKERLRAAEMLARRYALFKDKVMVESNVSMVLVDDLED